jgi:hypothetical protein
MEGGEGKANGKKEERDVGDGNGGLGRKKRRMGG